MYSIRTSRSEDIPSIVDFQLNLAAETENLTLDRAVVLTGVQALFTDPSKGVYSVVEHANTIVGCYLITYEWSDWRNGVVWWLQSVYVDTSHRRQGVFKRMYDHIVQTISKDPGVTGLRLYVDQSNERAQSVYRSLGLNGDHYKVFEWMKPKELS